MSFFKNKAERQAEIKEKYNCEAIRVREKIEEEIKSDLEYEKLKKQSDDIEFNELQSSDKKYHVLSDLFCSDLAVLVNKFIAHGWSPLGGVNFVEKGYEINSRGHSVSGFYIQTMIRG